MSTEEHRGSISSSSSSCVKASKRSKHHKSQKSSRSRQQSNSLDITSVIIQMPEPAQYSNPAATKSNTEVYCPFCFDSFHMSEVCLISLQNILMALRQKKDVNSTRTFGYKPYRSTKRDRLQYLGTVRVRRTTNRHNRRRTFNSILVLTLASPASPRNRSL